MATVNVLSYKLTHDHDSLWQGEWLVVVCAGPAVCGSADAADHEEPREPWIGERIAAEWCGRLSQQPGVTGDREELVATYAGPTGMLTGVREILNIPTLLLPVSARRRNGGGRGVPWTVTEDTSNAGIRTGVALGHSRSACGPDGRLVMMPIPLPSPSAPGSWAVPNAPLLPRLALETTLSRDGMFDGAWWPRSRNIGAELPDLITALSVHLGRILRVGLDTGAWNDIPRSVTSDGLLVKVSWFTSSDDTISLTRGMQDHFLLLVVPPGTDPRTAAAAMAGAACTGNHTTAAELLAVVVAPVDS